MKKILKYVQLPFERGMNKKTPKKPCQLASASMKFFQKHTSFFNGKFLESGSGTYWHVRTHTKHSDTVNVGKKRDAPGWFHSDGLTPNPIAKSHF